MRYMVAKLTDSLDGSKEGDRSRPNSVQGEEEMWQGSARVGFQALLL